jgi:transposase
VQVILTPEREPPLFEEDRQTHSHLSFMSRAAIVIMDRLGFPKESIMHWVGCSQKATNRCIRRYEDHDDLEDEPKIGRPPLLTGVDRQAVVSTAEERKFVTPKMIKAELELAVSTRTIRRTLDQAGLRGRVARLSYPFTEEHIDARMAFATRHNNWTEDDWSKVLFSDEAHFILGIAGQLWVQRPEDAAFLADYMAGSQPFPQKISVWGSFSAAGVGPMQIIDTTMTSRELTDIFEKKLLPGALQIWPQGSWFLLQDNAPYHASNETKRWLHNHGVSCIDFPPYSPDLNPIENLWAYLKRRIESRFPKDIEELQEFLLEEWANIDPNLTQCLSDSMIQRCAAVEASGGFMTKY